MSKITDIKDIDSMISFLREKGGNHEHYYHYTTWDSLSKILKNRNFLLTRGNSLSIASLATKVESLKVDSKTL